VPIRVGQIAGAPREARIAKMGLRNNSKDTSAIVRPRKARILRVRPSNTVVAAIFALAASCAILRMQLRCAPQYVVTRGNSSLAESDPLYARRVRLQVSLEMVAR
jgi:hypothetical protein